MDVQIRRKFPSWGKCRKQDDGKKIMPRDVNFRLVLKLLKVHGLKRVKCRMKMRNRTNKRVVLSCKFKKINKVCKIL